MPYSSSGKIQASHFFAPFKVWARGFSALLTS